MNSIFVRIYGGMIAACCLIGIIFYIAIEATNYFRLQHFRNDLVAGPLRLMAQSVAQRSADEREQWIQYLERMLGTRIELRTSDNLSVSSTELSQLSGDGLVLRLSSEGHSGEAIIRIPNEDALYLYAQADRVTEQQARGVAIVLSDYLGRIDVAEWSGALTLINASFGFPVRRIPPHQVSLTRGNEIRLFRHREVVVQFHEQRGATLMTAMLLLPQTGEILHLGPLDMFDWYPIELLGAMLVVAFAMVGLAAYLLVKPLEGRLSRLERAVIRIRGGDLSARAPVEGNDAIGQLAGTLNGMAEHIQRLISAQKELSRAVSHELRTPVARIRFGLEVLLDEDDPDRRQKSFDAIDNDIEQLDKLIDEILTYSKLEGGTPVLDFTMIDVDALLRQIEHETKGLGKEINVTYESPGLPKEKCFAEGEERY
ncbi:MAG: two-component sensor histidine kinase, partial [Moraxellaceae bacterium]